MLENKISELLYPDVNDNSETARTLLRGTCCFNETLDADSIDDPRSSHLGCDPLVICAVAREHPQSEGGCNSTSLNVGNDIVGETPRHREQGSSDACAVADNSLAEEFELSDSALYVGNNIGSCIEQAKVKNIITLWDQMFLPR